MDQSPFVSAAHLAAIFEGTRHAQVHGPVQVGSGQNDHGVLAPEFEPHLPDVGRGRFHNAGPGPVASHEGQRPDRLIGHNCFALPAGPLDQDDDVIVPERFGHQLDDPFSQDRSQFGGLEHHRIAGQQRRNDAPDRDGEGEVPGSDGAHHSVGPVMDHTGRFVQVDGFGFQVGLRPFTEVADPADGGVDFTPGLGDRFALLPNHQPGKVVGFRLDVVGQLTHDVHPFGDGRILPIGLGPIGPFDQFIDPFGGRFQQFVQNFTGGRIQRPKNFAAHGSRTPFPSSIGSRPEGST